MYSERIFGDINMINNEKSENQQISTKRITDRWESCESIDEAKGIVDYIIAIPSEEWLALMTKAERGEVKYSELLREHSDAIYSSIAEAVANSDNLVKLD